MKLETTVFIGATVAYLGVLILICFTTYFSIIIQFYLTVFPSILFIVAWSMLYFYWLRIGFKIRKLEKNESKTMKS